MPLLPVPLARASTIAGSESQRAANPQFRLRRRTKQVNSRFVGIPLLCSLLNITSHGNSLGTIYSSEPPRQSPGNGHTLLLAAREVPCSPFQSRASGSRLTSDLRRSSRKSTTLDVCSRFSCGQDRGAQQRGSPSPCWPSYRSWPPVTVVSKPLGRAVSVSRICLRLQLLN